MLENCHIGITITLQPCTCPICNNICQWTGGVILNTKYLWMNEWINISTACSVMTWMAKQTLKCQLCYFQEKGNRVDVFTLNSHRGLDLRDHYEKNYLMLIFIHSQIFSVQNHVSCSLYSHSNRVDYLNVLY